MASISVRGEVREKASAGCDREALRGTHEGERRSGPFVLEQVLAAEQHDDAFFWAVTAGINTGDGVRAPRS